MKTLMFCVAALMAATTAEAAPAQPAPATTIRVGDLDLRDEAQARQMLVRIRNASAAVCRATPGASGNDIGAIELYDRCFREAVARAVGRLDAPLVTAAHEAKAAPRRLAWQP